MRVTTIHGANFMRLLITALTSIVLTIPAIAQEAKKSGEFFSKTIDVGMVVSDVGKSANFYTKAIGFTEVPGFEVGGEYATAVGLTEGKALKVRVFVLGEGDGATKLKLIQFPDSKPKKNDSDFIDRELGVRYLTIFVNDVEAARKKYEAAGAKAIARGPQPLPKGFPEGWSLVIIRDPDGNMVELVGPAGK